MKWMQTKEVTEMDRVMESIAQSEAEMQQRIFQLGQMYYDENKDKGKEDIEEKYYTLIDLIRKLELNRKGFYKNKLRLEGKMQCENCGSVIPYGSVYCSICGKKADEKQEGDPVNMSVSVGKCKVCGADLEEDSLFCTSCGAKVE